MTLSVWRYAHFTLAVVSSLFLLMASITGIILAVDAVGQKLPPYRVANFEEITLSKVIPTVKDKFLEVNEITVDHNQFVTLKGLDENGNEIEAYIDVNSGKIIGKPEKKNEFIQWVTSLHRSLFLHDTGRIIIGINAFLLFLIAVSGTILMIQRQKGFLRFFSAIPNEGWMQFLHVFTGRWFLLPILIISLSGTYLTINRLKWFDQAKLNHKELSFPNKAPEEIEIRDFKTFQNIKLSEVQKIEFPFTDDVEEFYTLKLNDRELLVNQFNGSVLSEIKYPKTVLLETLTLDLHTGRANSIWAIILGISSISILFFIYSGFSMSWKRMKNKIKNQFSADESSIIILVGSENGSTLGFANAIQKQLVSVGKKVFITEMNALKVFPKAEQILLFTSTHGLGDAPSNATQFEKLIAELNYSKPIQTSVVGFGSTNYPDFCGYAKKVELWLQSKSWNKTFIGLRTINDKSVNEFVEWVKSYNQINGTELSTTPAQYINQPKALQKFEVESKTLVSEECQTFVLTLKPYKKIKFQSGDLLAIYPGNEGKERLYSIGKVDGKIQLVVKLHEFGLGSNYLRQLEVGSHFEARIVENKSFHLPNKKEVILIANGTGIAPFLGMINKNTKSVPLHLYAGFRKETPIVKGFKTSLETSLANKKIKDFQFALSRQGNHCYVTQIVQNDAAKIASILQNSGVVMICGSLAMYKDIIAVLDQICIEKTNHNLAHFQAKGQILSDCY
ncbi:MULTISPECIES: PepSY domain-containing protein [Flavobacterium]|nr:PepSY domain-containing protein [Flavobacterium sp. N1846]